MGNYGRLIYEPLFLDGDGSTFDSAVDGSGTAQSFYIECPAQRKYVIHRMIVQIRDGTALGAEDYGAIAGGLGTGILVRIRNSAEVLFTLTDIPVQTNADWALMCYDATPLDFGNGDNYLRVRWTFEKSGKPIILTVGERLEVLIQDDLTDLVSQRFVVEGWWTAPKGAKDYKL